MYQGGMGLSMGLMKKILEWFGNKYQKGSKLMPGAFLVGGERLEIYASFEFYAFFGVMFVANHL
jgi:hypothetical protein